MAHNSSCANAATWVCRCAGCVGSLHGWPGYIAAVHDGPAQARLSETAERDWAKATLRGVEGTGSYGAGLARHLTAAGDHRARGRPARPAGPPG